MINSNFSRAALFVLDVARRWSTLIVSLSIFALLLPAASDAQLIVTGSPTYNSATAIGLREGEVPIAPGWGVNNSGRAVGHAEKYDGTSVESVGDRPVRWDAGGTAVELGILGTDFLGFTFARAVAVNDAGTSVGFVDKYSAGEYVGSRAVRWATGSTAATELGNIGTSFGYTDAAAFAINTAGLMVGNARKFDGSGNDTGTRAVRWAAGGTAATELAALGTATGSGETSAAANAVNTSGLAVGSADKYTSGVYRGARAVRWAAAGTAATELGHLGTDNGSSGNTIAEAYAVNDLGVSVGWAEKYVSNLHAGERAVRWAAAGTAATELGNLGTHASGETYARAFAVNAGGTAVGESEKYVDQGGDLVLAGRRAVRWNAAGTAATELANLGTGTSEEGVTGFTSAAAYSVNDAGTAVGYSEKYTAGNLVGNRAVIWLANATVIDLNDLGITANPVGGTWLLTEARALAADGWVAGTGTFTPTSGAAYARHWVSQVGLGGTWTNAVTSTLNGTWGRGRQWSTGTPAMQVGDAVFSSNNTYTVSLDRHETTRTIAVSAGNMKINFAGFNLTAQNGLTISSGATFGGHGTIVGNIANDGTLTPGVSLGILNVGGNYSQSATGKLQIELGATGNDRLQVSGSLTLAGTLEVLLLAGYTPSAGTGFNILDFTSHTGTFTTLQLPALSPSLAWNADALYTTGVLSVAQVGDWNGDHAVTALDYVLLRKAGASESQYDAWRQNFGAGFSGSGNGSELNNAAVPEPASIALMGMAVVAVAIRRRRA